MKEYTICLDLDGTLLANNKTISKKNIAAICMLKERGYSVILISGRHFSEMTEYSELLGLSDGDYIVCCDGIYIYDNKGKRIATLGFLSIDDAKTIYTALQCKKMYLVTADKDFVIINDFYERLKNVVSNILFQKKHNVCSLYNKKIQNIEIEKIRIANCTNAKGYQLIKADYTLHKTALDGIEILKKEVNKAAALIHLVNSGLISCDNIYYIGDDYNDEECFRLFSHSIAMGNAPDDLKAICAYITKSNDLDGVAEAIENYILVET